MIAAQKFTPPLETAAHLPSDPQNELAMAREKTRRRDRRPRGAPNAGYVIRLARPRDDQVEGLWGATRVPWSGPETG